MSEAQYSALVTGAASGIGRAVAQALVAVGRPVALLDCDAAGLGETVARCEAAGAGSAAAFPVDLRDRQALFDAIRRAEQTLGPLDAVANVAGVIRMAPVVPTPERTALSDADWDDCFESNTRALLHLAQAVMPGMIARRRGAWVTVASNAARTPRLGMAAYAASKAAAVHFTRCLGLEVAEHGVRCNSVSPGSTDTPMQAAFWRATGGNAERVIRGDLAQHRLGIPLGRIAAPADVAACVAFLLSDAARQITLQDLCVDGGATP